MVLLKIDFQVVIHHDSAEKLDAKRKKLQAEYLLLPASFTLNNRITN